MHFTEDAENEILISKFALLPIVPYSPCLNEVAEGYFGLIKSNTIFIGDVGKDHVKRKQIEDNWKITSDQRFDENQSISLYAEWMDRLEICKEGLPIYSGHVHSIINIENPYLFNNLRCTVDRLKSDIEK